MLSDQYVSRVGKGFTISHLNVRSLIKHKDESFLCLTGDDVICFSETWLSPKIGDPLLSQVGYKYIRCDRQTMKKGGGLICSSRIVMIYRRNCGLP